MEEEERKPVKQMTEAELFAELDKLQRPKDARRMEEIEEALGGGGFIS